MPHESSLISQHDGHGNLIRRRIPAPAYSRGLRLHGSRLTLAATYRLASSVPVSDREMILTLTGLDSEEERRSPKGEGVDFELAATNCLAGLYVKLALGRPTIVARNGASPPAPAPPLPDLTVRLRLGMVRAVSSTRVEYYLKPTLYCRQHDDASADIAGVPAEPAFRLLDGDPENPDSVTFWAVRRGRESQLVHLHHAVLPKARTELVAGLRDLAGGRLDPLEGDLLGLDEWRFQEGLRVAFALLAA